jgi:hypothetical protein
MTSRLAECTGKDARRMIGTLGHLAPELLKHVLSLRSEAETLGLGLPNASEPIASPASLAKHPQQARRSTAHAHRLKPGARPARTKGSEPRAHHPAPR